MEDNVEKKLNYKIWHFGKNKHDRVVDERFWAEDDNDAYLHLQNYLCSHDIGKKHYYSTIHYSCIIDSKGRRSQEFDIDDHCLRYKLWYESKSWFARILEDIKFFFSYWLVDKPKDLYYWARDTIYLLKNKEAYSNQWNLDMHILDSIERNVPSLIKNSQALAFIDEAIEQVHGKDKDFDLKQYHLDHCQGYPEDIEALAVKIQNEEYAKLLLHVKLYKYYAEFGNIDFDDNEQVKFDSQWRHTLPIKKGTYDEILDYKLIEALAKEQWNAIWDWMKKHGQKLCD